MKYVHVTITVFTNKLINKKKNNRIHRTAKYRSKRYEIDNQRNRALETDKSNLYNNVSVYESWFTYRRQCR